MEERLKRLIEELGAAMNDSVFQSEQIRDVVAKIKGEGYDAFLVVNAAIVIRRQEEEPASLAARKNGAVQSRFSAEDMRFLKSLHISVNR